ncbi:laccase [Paxillus rubicundulus Ve08.2h10]|uniref:laccase n=1 Tax=Paxillus rubicundulus Ve08.2h10 TaxID=930991 RepID=A0A0D0DHX0_9AGAM|nr:laccase [Paxillus rubicundulus Ve08.2h10]
MNSFYRITLFALSLVACAAAKTVAELDISNAVVSPDGFSRSAIVVNGVTPGSLLTGTKGESFQIKVKNSLTDESMNMSTSVHWHGIIQYHSNAMDGTAFVTQCPIVSGSSFIYTFTPPNQAGTFWYHSHFRLQYCEGLRGAMVIYDPHDPYLGLYDVDDESTIITLADWYHINAFDVKPINIPDSLLINGVGRYPGGPATPLAVINVVQGKRYRIRLLNIGCKPDYQFSIDNHTFTVIEADGEPTQPLVVDSIPISAAQRYSFILEANQTVDNYYIRVNPTSYRSTFDGGLNSAILRYSGAPIEDPPDRTWPTVNPLEEYNLQAANDPGAPGVAGVGNADINLNLVAQINQTTARFQVNGVSYESPSTPVLLQLLSGALTATQLQPQGSVYVLPRNKVVEVSFPGALLAAAHPFHLHGHKFDVVRSAGVTGYNYVNPVRRDTVSSGSVADNVTIRFTTNNPGPWFLHCHIDFHLDLGMAVVFAEAPENTAQVDSVNGQWNQLCPTYDSLPPSEQ